MHSPHSIYCSLFSSVDYSHQGQHPIIKLTLLLTFSTMSSCDFIFYSEMNIQYWSLPHEWMHQTKFSSIGRRYRHIYFYLILHIVWYNMQKLFSKIFDIKYWFKIATPDYLFTLILRDKEKFKHTWILVSGMQKFLFLFSTLKYTWHTALCIFQMYNILVWYIYIL